VRGPVYETPAEVRMLARLGADLVCMSTVPEAIRARALGVPVAALLCVANRGAGLGSGSLAHGDVLAHVEAAVLRRGGWLLEGITALAALA
jgi:purine-nucleoside phosphorylase